MNEKNRSKTAISNCREAFVYAGLTSVFINILMLVPTFYMLQVYDRVISSGSKDTLLMLTILLVFLLAFMGTLQWIRNKLLSRAANIFDQSVNTHAFQASFTRSLQNPSSLSSAQILNDVNGFRQFISGHAVTALFDIPWVPVYLGVMFLFHPWYGWIALFAALLLISFTLLNAFLIQSPQEKGNQFLAAAGESARSSLGNAEVIQGMGMLNRLQARWLNTHEQALINQTESADRIAIISNISRTLRLILQSLILGAGALLVLNQEISPGLMIAGSILLGRALAPIDQLTGAWQSVVSAHSQYQRLKTVFLEQPFQTDTMELPKPKGMLTLDKATVAVPKTDNSGTTGIVLKNLSFQIPAGDTVAVIGPSASGKSSLARALLGVWPAISGSIRLDGADISQWDREALGPHIGYLPQTIELFSGTVKENIARFGDIDADEVVSAAKKAGVHDLILKLPEGYDTQLGSQGVGLSGGQKQRIALARALYGSPKIIVLDEPNSNLDEAGELALAVAIKHCKNLGSTVVIISHRQSILFQVDKILVMAEGQLSMYGPRDAVLQKLRGNSQSQAQPRTSTDIGTDSEPVPNTKAQPAANITGYKVSLTT